MADSARTTGTGLDVGKRLKGLLLKRSGLALGLWGEAGIGKTHAAQALLRQTPCASFSLHSAAPLKRWLEVLPRPKALDPWAARILDRLAAGDSAPNAAEALGALLAKLAPVVLHLEDLHEADAERAGLIAQLAAMAPRSKGVGLLITSRGGLPAALEAVELERLSDLDSRGLLEAQAGAELPAEAIGWIFARASGNPLFTLEYFRHLSRMGNLWNDGRRWRWRAPEQHQMPSTVEALLERRLREAADTPELEGLLEAKAFLGAEDTALAEVTGMAPGVLASCLRSLEARGILLRGEFAHPLLREVLLQNLPRERRAELARRALASLAKHPAQVAAFLDDAGLAPAQARAWLERAAEAAQAAGDGLQAGRLKARAVPYIADEAERGRRAFEAAVALYPYDLSQSIALLEAAWAVRAGDFEVYKHLLVELAEAGRRAEVERLFEVFPAEDRHSQRGFMLTLHAWHYLDRYAEVLRLWETKPELHAGISPFILRNVAYAKAALGDPAGATALAQEALARPDLTVLQRVVLLEACGFAGSNGSDFAAAEGFYDQAIALFEADGQAHRSGSLLFNRAIARLSLGRFAEARGDAERALELAAEGAQPLFYANAQLALGVVLTEQGHYDRAEEALQACHAHYRQAGLGGWQVDAELRLGELYRAWPLPHAEVLAQKHAFAALRLAQTLEDRRYAAGATCGAALTEARFASPQRALTLAEQGYAAAAGLGEPMGLCQALCARAAAHAALGQTRQAVEDFRQAQGHAQRVGARHEVGKIGLELARLENDLNSAREHLRWFEANGLMNGANLAHRLFPELAAQPGPVRDEAGVRLEVLGPMQIVGGEGGQPVRGQKRRELLALLLEARVSGRREAGKLELLEVLYPGADELQAATALRDMVYQLRELFGQGLVRTTDGGYALGEVGSDAELFLRSGDTRLWRGAYLEGVGLEAGDTVREALHLNLRARAEALLEADPTEAVRVGKILLEADPYSPESLRLTLRALQALKNHKGLSRTYARAKEHWLEVGERLPESWAEFVAGG